MPSNLKIGLIRLGDSPKIGLTGYIWEHWRSFEYFEGAKAHLNWQDTKSRHFGWTTVGNPFLRHPIVALRNKWSFRIGLNKTEWRSMQIASSWRWQGTWSFLDPPQIIFGGSSSQCGLHMKAMPNKDVGLHYAQRNMKRRMPCIVYMHVFGCVAYTMMPDEKRGKFDAKGTKCSFLDYCEETLACRLMCS